MSAAVQVLPRRKGDLWIHVSSVFFKTWERRHAVIDGALSPLLWLHAPAPGCALFMRRS